MITADLHLATTGDVACGRHAPTPGSAMYSREEWQPMTAFDAGMLTALREKAPSCRTCICEGYEIDDLAP